MATTKDPWGVGGPYHRFMGRWSALAAPLFLDWLGAPAGRRWLDLGCGTGSLSRTILARTDPAFVLGLEPAAGFLKYAVRQSGDPRLQFASASGAGLPVASSTFDCLVCGLVLNFIPDPAAALEEMKRVVRPGGRIAAYVWDYADGMRMLRHFWDAAGELDPGASELDEALRFPLCAPGPLEALFSGAGLDKVEVEPIEFVSVFRDFDDYWEPFLGGQGPAPGYVARLEPAGREDLAARVRARLHVGADGRIALLTRAWAVNSRV